VIPAAGMWVSLVWIRGCVGVTFVDCLGGREGDD
jgi:hypothetical protein